MWLRRPRLSSFLSTIFVGALALALSQTAHAQLGGGAQPGGGGFGRQPPPQPQEEEFVPKDVGPLPTPLDPEMEAARERSDERGVLRSEKAMPGRIYSIRIRGARKVEPDAVLVHVQSRVDKRPDQKIIQDDVKRIYRMGLFSDVIVKTSPGPENSVLLIYELIEKPAIANIKYEGNSEVGEDDIKEVVDLKSYQVLDIPRVRHTVSKIQKLYIDKGYFLAEVEYELRPSDGPKNPEGEDESNLLDAVMKWIDKEGDGFPIAEWITGLTGDDDEEAVTNPTGTPFIDIIFKVDEHVKVKVEQLEFVGNEKLSGDKLRNSIGTRENHPLGILTDWGTYKEEIADLDLLATEAVYQDEGYINVRVGTPRVALSPDKTRLSIRIPIDEGAQYRLSGFDVRGDLCIEDVQEYQRLIEADNDTPVFLKTNLVAGTRVRKGDVFSRTTVAEDVMAIADRYRDRGYAYVNINPLTQVNDEENTVELILDIQAGPRVKIERIEVTGNSKTQDRVIRRELRIYEGEWYSASALRLSEQRVTALGFFEHVEVTTRQGRGPDRLVAIFSVTEKATGTFQLGAGFSNAEQFIFTGQISQNNFLGRGVTVSGSVQLSAFRNIVDVRYIDPYFLYDPFFNEPMTFAFSLFNTQRNFIDFFRNSTGADLTWGYPIGRPGKRFTLKLREAAPSWLRPYTPDFENMQLFVTVNAERVEIGEGSFNVRLVGLNEKPRYTTSVRGSFIFDQRNNRLFPSQGYYFQVSAEGASQYLGSGLAPPVETFLKNQTKALGLIDSIGPINPNILKRDGLPNNFVRLTSTSRIYFSLNGIIPYDGVVIKGNLEMGLLLTPQPNTLVFEQFFLGGFNTIRGYFPRSIGPVERVGGLSPDEPLQEFRVGGNKQIYANLELEIPIFEQVGIRGVIFLDMGNAYSAEENPFYLFNGPTPGLSKLNCGVQQCFDPRTDLPLGLYYAIGVGIRWFSPIGPLRFEWGIPLTPRPAGTVGFRRGDDPVQFEFNIGNSF